MLPTHRRARLAKGIRRLTACTVVPSRNIVATCNLGIALDLKTIAMHARNAEYNPKVRACGRVTAGSSASDTHSLLLRQRFSAVIMRIREPKTCAAEPPGRQSGAVCPGGWRAVRPGWWPGEWRIEMGVGHEKHSTLTDRTACGLQDCAHL